MKKLFSFLLVMVSLLYFSDLMAKEKNGLRHKLNSIIIDKLEVEDASIEAVINLLREKSKNLDPDKQGVNIVLLLTPPGKKSPPEKHDGKDIISDAAGENQKTVTLMFTNISLRSALKNICRAAGLVYKEEKYAVVIAHKDFPLSKMETRIYPVAPEAYQQIKSKISK